MTSYRLGELAERLGVRLKGDPDLVVRGIGTLDQAGNDQLSFLANKRYAHLLATTRAAAVIVDAAHEQAERTLLIADQPYVAMARAAQLFVPPIALNAGVDPSAFIDPTAELAADARLGPLAQVGAGSRIGAGSVILGGAYLGREVAIGRDCLIYPNVSILDRSVLGDRVIVHSGTVIGSDGYGFAQDENGHHVKIPQTGLVQVDDDVEIGANCCIDRATFGRTWIQRGCKIDNLVQIAHNVVIGEDALLVAQVGIAGSTRVGRQVVLGGQVGVAGHLAIADGVRVGASSGVAHSIDAAQDVLGSPAVPIKEWMRTYANIQRLPKLKDQVRLLEQRLARLEQAAAAHAADPEAME